MQYGAVADGNVFADNQWRTFGFGRRAAADVQHAAVLYVGARADADVVDVAAHDGARPDGYVVRQYDIADDDGGGIQVNAFAQLRQDVAEGAEVHGLLLTGFV